MDPRLVNDVKRAENCKLVAYRDTKDFWTIGWGHKLLDQSHNWTDYTISQTQADQYLIEDIGEAEHLAKGLPEWTSLDTDCRRNAVLELVFNMGYRTWRTFEKTRNAIDQKEWQAAHDELLNSEWAPEVGHERSTRLANYLLNGAYP